MKRVLGWIFNRWVLLAVLLLALAVVLWITGPLFAFGDSRPLESERARWTTLLVLFALVAVRVAWSRWRARRTNTSVVNELMQQRPSGKAAREPESPDLAAVRERFQRALLTLQRARFGAGGRMQGLQGWVARLGGRYLYELPWYLIIGAPGSGKTTALRHSGLKFPLAEQMGEHAVQGVGGTRHCDWWFTDQAVLIDTAGRFTTQDSDPGTDGATWSGFLQLLRRSRPRQPVNGVLVTVSVADLLARSRPERTQHAATVRARVQELHEDLGHPFPIYLLVTKADLMAGFMDYFATVDKDQRATPWGFTFPRSPQGAPLASFAAEYQALEQRLVDGLIDRLQAERDPQRRARIYGFPAQFAGLRQALQEFAEGVFAPSPFEANPQLRGVYFVSGTQEGTPIDRVLGAVARSYQLERAVIAPNQASGRSYFLNRLLSEVVFAESGLAGTNRKWERQRTALAIAGYAAVGVVGIGLLVAWNVSYLNNRRYVADVASRAEKVQQLLRTTPNRASTDILPIVPALEATRALAATTDGRVPWSLGFGLFQGRKLDSAARASYQRMLGDALLPRLALRIEEQLRQGAATPETLYEALKAYVMLYDPDNFDPAALKRHIETDWQTQRRELTPDQRAQLSQHLDALLALGGATSPLPEDKALLSAMRTQLATVPLPQRIYNRLRAQGLGTEFPEFTVIRAAGDSAALVFTRQSGAPLTQGVPGLYSRDGYLRGFQREVGRVAEELAKEQSWVLGVADAPKDAAALVRANGPLTDDVRRLYLTDYAAAWESFVADVRLLPMTSLAQSVQMSRLLSAPDSPLPPLLKAMSRETTLASGGSAIEKVEQQAAGVVQQSRDKLASLFTAKTGGAAAGANTPRLEGIVDDRFAGLRQLVLAPPGGKPPLDDTLALIAEVNVLLNAVETAVKGGAAPPVSPVPNKVKAEAARMPQPLRAMLDNLSQTSGQLSQVMVRQNLGQEVKSQVGEFCQQAVAGRYPVDRNASRDATQADFALLFGPGGKIDQLFQQKLASYVDTTTRPWRFRAVEGTPLGSDSGTLPQFQRAAAIRETFFPGGNAPSLRLDFKPVEMDPSITQFILDVDGQIVRYAHGPQIPMSVQWPGPRGSSQVRVQVSPPSAVGSSGLVTDGPWALFRLFDRVRIDPTNAPERFRATFDIDGRKAVFEVTASSVRNPFRLRELNEFSCPAGL